MQIPEEALTQPASIHKSSPPECALQVPVMKIGVPGEFHEDRWPRTAEDLREACASAHTGSGLRHPDTSYRVAKRSSDRSSARSPLPQPSQSHPRVAKESSIGSLALRPCPQVPQWHPRVAKGVFRPVFATATHPTGTPVPSLRGEATPNRYLTGL